MDVAQHSQVRALVEERNEARLELSAQRAVLSCGMALVSTDRNEKSYAFAEPVNSAEGTLRVMSGFSVLLRLWPLARLALMRRDGE